MTVLRRDCVPLHARAVRRRRRATAPAIAVGPRPIRGRRGLVGQPDLPSNADAVPRPATSPASCSVALPPRSASRPRAPLRAAHRRTSRRAGKVSNFLDLRHHADRLARRVLDAVHETIREEEVTYGEYKTLKAWADPAGRRRRPLSRDQFKCCQPDSRADRRDSVSATVRSTVIRRSISATRPAYFSRNMRPACER